MKNRGASRSAAGLVLSVSFVILLAGGYLLYRRYVPNFGRSARVLRWLRNPGSHSGWSIEAGQRCGEAPFIMPTTGLVGYLWDDSFRPGHRHQGIDIFGGTEVGLTPVIAAYSGYLTRLPDWKATVIIRIPEDPLQPQRQIWTYYTHMAGPDGDPYIAADFPAGTQEVFVEAGTLLGYQGNYSGTAGNPVGVHLHFSIVRDDGRGEFLNELHIENTLDPSPYLGLALRAGQETGDAPVCDRPTQGEEHSKTFEEDL
jgi:murein DD-endopeptidase MepM/ murein hydrolase activator NlpD